MRDCHDCQYCGPDRPQGMIRCDHISWTHWDEDMRVFAPDFAPECDSFEPKSIASQMVKITQKREALRVMKRNAKRRLGGKHTWSDMDAKAAIKAAESEIREIKAAIKASRNGKESA